ncbi:glycosyl hydrolase family 95 catalytic domain-containing protein [Streptomyces jeddahensis]|uniref:FCD domain protein n=1 Tax=Streptomyces jeddahensis TaxID=1716141 RepID=A0A177HVJ8_9ACTN|nr:glycoside hydrolase N-terminal domain-containing protein [Streptomyces jeddahensis]OAH14244.1 FCD domain protein [Streptomyces jeddahensis]
MFEPVATGLAATRISAQELAEVERHLDAMRAPRDEVERLNEHDAAFHRAMIAATGNATLTTLLEGISSRTLPPASGAVWSTTTPPTVRTTAPRPGAARPDGGDLGLRSGSATRPIASSPSAPDGSTPKPWHAREKGRPGMPVHSIHDTEPASRWEDAFLSGNGEYGIMVFGHPHRERIVHNHHRYVLPNGSLGMRPPAVADRLEHVRDLLLAGEREQAQREFSDGREIAWTQAFHPGHVLHLDAPTAGRVDQYRRVTDFTTGEVRVTWSDGDQQWARRAFVSRTDAVAVVEMTGPQLDVDVRLSGDLQGRPPEVAVTTSAQANGGGEASLAVVGTYPAGLGAAGFIGVTRVVASGGHVTVEGDVARVQGATRVVLLTRMDRSAAPPRPDALQAALAELPADYSELLARHAAVHGALYARAELDLGVPENARRLPVRELIARADAKVLDAALVEAMFHSGRYLLLSSCGVLPPRLTGLWLGAWGAAWSGDFTTDANINLQMAGVVTTGMPELMDSYTALISGQIEDWRTNARTIYGARGVLAPNRTDGEHGMLFHLNDEWPFPMWVASTDWLLFPLYEYWQATGDDDFLARTLAPWLVEAAVFFEDVLTREDSEGHIVIVPSYSPEVGPRDGRGMSGVNATMDIAAARHALTTAADVCAHLGIEQEATSRWLALAKRLPPYRVDDHGALAEWAWPGLETAESHRHVSHLYPVWPLHDITPDDTPDLAEAAREALLRRGDENLSAHGSLHRALAAARLQDSETARVNLLKILGRNMVFRSLMTSHNPDLDIYNADAAHCLPAVVVEMLVDSRPGIVELLPALPPEWTNGSLRGIATRTGVALDELSWDTEDGMVRAVLTSAEEQSITLVCRGAQDADARRQHVDLPARTPVTVIVRLASDSTSG